MVLIRHRMLMMTVIFIYLKIVLVRGEFQFRYVHPMFRSLLVLFWCLNGDWLGVKSHVDLLSDVILEGCHALVVAEERALIVGRPPASPAA